MYVYGGLAHGHLDIRRAPATRFAEGLANDRKRMLVELQGRKRGIGHDPYFVS